VVSPKEKRIIWKGSHKWQDPDSILGSPSYAIPPYYYQVVARRGGHGA